jgi:hypothetical protein
MRFAIQARILLNKSDSARPYLVVISNSCEVCLAVIGSSLFSCLVCPGCFAATAAMHSNCRGAVFLNLQSIAKAVFGNWKLNYCSFEAWRVIVVVISIFGGSPKKLITNSIKGLQRYCESGLLHRSSVFEPINANHH